MRKCKDFNIKWSKTVDYCSDLDYNKYGLENTIMKDVQKLAAECLVDLATLGIPYGRVKRWVINSRAKARWGLCKKLPDGCFEIEIAETLLQDDVADMSVKNTVMHELLHTCPGCLRHTGKWKQYATLVNRRMPIYNITRTTSSEEKGVTVRRKEPVYRYILKCSDCGGEIRRQKKSRVVEHPEKYRCTCGGKLIRKQ